MGGPREKRIKGVNLNILAETHPLNAMHMLKKSGGKSIVFIDRLNMMKYRLNAICPIRGL